MRKNKSLYFLDAGFIFYFTFHLFGGCVRTQGPPPAYGPGYAYAAFPVLQGFLQLYGEKAPCACLNLSQILNCIWPSGLTGVYVPWYVLALCSDLLYLETINFAMMF